MTVTPFYFRLYMFVQIFITIEVMIKIFVFNFGATVPYEDIFSYDFFTVDNLSPDKFALEWMCCIPLQIILDKKTPLVKEVLSYTVRYESLRLFFLCVPR